MGQGNRYYWSLVNRGQGYCSTSLQCTEQSSTTKNFWLKMSRVSRLRNPGYKMNGVFTSEPLSATRGKGYADIYKLSVVTPDVESRINHPTA